MQIRKYVLTKSISFSFYSMLREYCGRATFVLFGFRYASLDPRIGRVLNKSIDFLIEYWIAHAVQTVVFREKAPEKMWS